MRQYNSQTAALVELSASSENTSRTHVFSREQYDALRNGAGTFDREDLRVIGLSGSDRLTYLHGLLTNDIVALKPGTGCYC